MNWLVEAVPLIVVGGISMIAAISIGTWLLVTRRGGDQGDGS